MDYKGLILDLEDIEKDYNHLLKPFVKNKNTPKGKELHTKFRVALRALLNLKQALEDADEDKER